MSEITTDRHSHIANPKKRAFLQALEASLGIVSQAIRLSGNVIHRETHYEWMKTDPDYAKAVEDVKNVKLDFAESQLHKNIKEGKEQSLIFFLKTQGRERGYKQYDEATEGGRLMAPPTINIIMPAGFQQENRTIIEMTGDCGTRETGAIPKEIEPMRIENPAQAGNFTV